MRAICLVLPITLMLAACAGDGGAGVVETPDGTKIDFSNGPKGWVMADTTNGRMKAYNQGESMYGAWLDSSNQVEELGYQGNRATEIPTSGRATYYGHAVRSENNDVNIIGKSRLNVDFDRKTVDGKLEMDGLHRDITLHEGRLNGAEFSGNASVLLNKNGRYSGALMGKGATEAVGLVKFDNESGLNTVFGGRRF